MRLDGAWIGPEAELCGIVAGACCFARRLDRGEVPGGRCAGAVLQVDRGASGCGGGAGGGQGGDRQGPPGSFPGSHRLTVPK
jgi:hypothetical protein